MAAITLRLPPGAGARGASVVFAVLTASFALLAPAPVDAAPNEPASRPTRPAESGPDTFETDGVTIWYEKRGHMPFYEEPEAFHARLEAFLE